MAAFLSPISLILQAFTNAGVILAGGKIATYDAGTTTPQTTYQEATLTVANDNPIILDSAGRLPAQVWITEGSTTKFVLMDSADVVLMTSDNIPLLNDTTAFFADLQDPASGKGADLVANAVKSYDTFTSLRAANEPALASGQTLIIVVEGGTSIGDGLGGAFYWSASSSATDDSVSVIKPTATSGAGRYLRISWAAQTGIDDTGTATQTLGWRDLPQNIQNANYSFVLADRGRQIYHGSGTHTYTMPQTGTGTGQVNWPLVAAVNVLVSTGTVFLIVTADTLTWYPTGSTGTRTLVAPADVVLKHIAAANWNLVGVGIT
jgi:hypothetical protein